MKKGWQTKTLDELCEIERGGSPRPIQKFLTNAPDGTNWVKIGDATASDKYIYKTEEKITADGVRRSRLVHEGDFLLSNSMSFGRPYIMKTTGCIHDGWLVLRQREKQLNQDLLYYILSSDEVFRQFDQLAAGSTVRNLNTGLVKRVQISFPSSHEEQKRVLSILDEAFADIATAKASARKNLQNARALFESQLQSLFTKSGRKDAMKTLGEIASTFGRGKSKHRPRNAPELYGGKYPFIQTGEIRNADHFITDYTQTYNEAGLAQSKLWPKGTICITIAANIAETGILDFDACFPDSVIGVVTNPEEAEAGYVEYLLQSFKARLQAMGKGSAQANINMGTFEFERFPFPNVAEQKSIATRLDSLRIETRRLETIYQQKLTLLEELKKSLLHQAFTGNL
jgi:type I restriction enzyme S subunit